MRYSFHIGLIASLLAAACGSENQEARKEAGADVHAADVHAAEGEGRALLPIMQELGVRMAALTHGLMVDSAELVAHNAQLMAEHAPIAAEELDRIKSTIGGDMAEFERIDNEVHGRLVRLREAAAAGLPADVLARLNEVQRGCVECHGRFRDRLRTSAAAPGP